MDSVLIEIAGLGATAAAAALLGHAYYAAARLPLDQLRRPSLLAAALGRPRSWLILLVTHLPLLAAWDRTGWWRLDSGLPVRPALLLLAAGLVWPYATYARNRYLGRWHLADRLVLVGTWAAMALHPGFVAPMLLSLHVILRQFDQPKCLYYTWTHLILPLELLLAFHGWLYASLLGARPGSLVAAMLAVTAAHYLVPAIAKLRVGDRPWHWLTTNRCSLLVVSSAINGWLARVPLATVARVAGALRPLDRLMAGATLAIELGAAGLLLHRSVAVALLLALIGLHVAIWLASGVCFWKWIVACAAMLLLVAPWSSAASEAVFTPGHLLAGLGLVAMSRWLLRPQQLGWEDTRLNNLFQLEADGASGARYAVDATALAPFEMPMQQSRLFFLLRQPVLVGTYGCNARRDRTGRGLGAAIERTGGDPAAIERLRHARGRRRYDPLKSREFDRFVQVMLRTMPSRRATAISWLAAPRHIFGSVRPLSATTDPPRRPPAFRGQEPIVRVRVRYLEVYIGDEGVRTVTDRVVREIEIERVAAGARAA